MSCGVPTWHLALVAVSACVESLDCMLVAGLKQAASCPRFLGCCRWGCPPLYVPQVEYIDLREAQRRAREGPEQRPLTVADIMHRHSQQDFGWWR